VVKAIAFYKQWTPSSVASAAFNIAKAQTYQMDIGGGVMIDMVKIPSGSFQMGQSGIAEPAHGVTISNDFYIGAFEITRAQWYGVVGNGPASDPDGGKPIARVSWDDICGAGGFLEKANALSGKNYRLPTEAEWEYAARGGLQTKFYWGDDGDAASGYAWLAVNSGTAAHRGGLKLPNVFNLFDMSGNVAEWCRDGYSSYPGQAAADPETPATGGTRVVRGGSYADDAGGCASAFRSEKDRAERSPSVGFRLVLPAGAAQTGKVGAVTISPAGGTYLAAQQVSITCATGGVTIKYTTDGTIPSLANGTAYSGPFTAGASTAVKAVAIKSEWLPSDMASVEYSIIAAQNVTIDLGGGVTFEMARIPAGTFQMGQEGTAGPVHTVTLSRDYFLGKFEVTQEQWIRVMNSYNPSRYYYDEKKPVELISWDMICGKGGFLDKINALKPAGYKGFRLPTEAEWEYACRAGTNTEYYWPGQERESNYAFCGLPIDYSNRVGPNQPGKLKPNAFGLYDMSGNVAEWCSDVAGAYGSPAVTDPAGPPVPQSDYLSVSRVVRGGSLFDTVDMCGSACRDFRFSNVRSFTIGFRLAISSN
jgi:formylglycine-generating enzyme required for sulfatase activity